MAIVRTTGRTGFGTAERDEVYGYNPTGGGEGNEDDYLFGFAVGSLGLYNLGGSDIYSLSADQLIARYVETASAIDDGGDFLAGGEGDDYLFGGAGDDFMTGGPDSFPNLDGFSGFSTGNDVLFGGWGNDRLAGGNAVNTPARDGSPGRDTLIGGPGDDLLFGSRGDDTAWYRGSIGDYVIAYLEDGTVRITAKEDTPYTVEGVDILTDMEFARFSDMTIRLDGGLPDIEPLVVTANGKPFVLNAAGDKAEAVGEILVGRVDGLRSILRAADAEGSYTRDLVSIKGDAFYAAIGRTAAPLFAGSVTINPRTQIGTVKEEGTPAGEFKLAGRDVAFQTIAVRPDALVLGASFTLPDELGGIVVDTVKLGEQGLWFTPDGLRFGQDLKISLDNVDGLTLFKTLKVDARDLSLEFRDTEQALLLRGQIDIKNVFKAPNSKLTLDVAGENFFRVTADDPPDFKGELEAEKVFSIGGWSLDKLKLKLDTTARTASGEATIGTPFGVQLGGGVQGVVSVGIKYDPFEIDSFGLGLDNLNLPLPGLPLFALQRIGGKVSGFAPSSTDAVEFEGNLGGSYGPQYKGQSVASLDITGKVSDKAEGSLEFQMLEVKLDKFGFKGSFSALEATGQGVLDWEKGTVKVSGQVSILEGAFKASAALNLDSAGNFNFLESANLAVPKGIPLIGGKEFANGKFAAQFTNDGNYANDFSAVWGTVTLRETILRVPIEFDVTAGFKIALNGVISRIGAHSVPELTDPSARLVAASAASAVDADAVLASSTFAVEAAAPYALLSAAWTEANDAARLRVVLPDGRTIDEVDFEANGIALVEELSGPTGRVAIAVDPALGRWTLLVVGPGALGEPTLEMLTETPTPELAFGRGPFARDGDVISIDYTALDPDSDAAVTFWYADASGELAGTLIGAAVEGDGAGRIAWDVGDVPDGEYRVYAMLDDGDNPLVRVVADRLVRVGPGDPDPDPRGPVAEPGQRLVAGTAANETLVGSAAQDLFFFDLALSPAGRDAVRGFGAADLLVTTVALFDSNGDGVVTFGGNRRLDFQPGGSAGFFGEDGRRITRLELDGTVTHDGVDYHVYSRVGSAAGTADLVFG